MSEQDEKNEDPHLVKSNSQHNKQRRFRRPTGDDDTSHLSDRRAWRQSPSPDQPKPVLSKDSGK